MLKTYNLLLDSQFATQKYHETSKLYVMFGKQAPTCITQTYNLLYSAFILVHLPL